MASDATRTYVLSKKLKVIKSFPIGRISNAVQVGRKAFCQEGYQIKAFDTKRNYQISKNNGST